MYPSIEEVESATQLQLCRWWRFLKSPGQLAINSDHFTETLRPEINIMDRIVERVKEGGGFTPDIRKQSEF